MSLVENLKYSYDQFKIQIPQWEILDKGVTVLWGDSGAGKTTILRILIGLENCPGMKWSFSGIDLASLKVPEKKLGVVFQSLELFPHLTGRQNIEFAARARKISAERGHSRLKKFEGLLKMTDFLDRSVGSLSGGERQRVALVRALIGEPRVLLLDEPFSALDESLRQEGRELLKEIVRTESIPTLLVTHDSQDVKFLADKISHLERGQLVS